VTRHHAKDFDMSRPRNIEALEATGSLTMVALLLAMTGIWLWQGGFWS
jgi:hypothetical protein